MNEEESNYINTLTENEYDIYLTGKEAAFKQCKREPLSDDEITKIWNQGGIPVRDTPKQVFKFTRAIEKAHGIGE